METILCQKIGRLSQGEVERVDFTDTVVFIAKDQVPRDRFKYVIYDRIVVDYRPPK